MWSLTVFTFTKSKVTSSSAAVEVLIVIKVGLDRVIVER